jgi:hypothetical protein
LVEPHVKTVVPSVSVVVFTWASRRGMQRLRVLGHRSPENDQSDDWQKKKRRKSGKRTRQNLAKTNRNMSSVFREPKLITRLRLALLAGPALGNFFFYANGIWVRYSLSVHADARAAAQPSKFVPIQSKLPVRSQVPHLLSSPSPKCYPYVSNPFHLLTTFPNIAMLPIWKIKMVCCPNRNRPAMHARTRLIVRLSHSAVFFSRNKLANSIFNHDLSAKRTSRIRIQSECISVLYNVYSPVAHVQWSPHV